VGSKAPLKGVGGSMPIALGLSRGKLLQKCVQVVDSFDPKKTTVDAYAEDAEVLQDKSVGEVEQKFIHQVFYGCVRYQKFLKLFVTSFLYKCPAIAVRSEQTLYMILGYLLFFRIEEMGASEMRQLFNSGQGSISALFALLKYTLDVEELEKWVKVEWCKVYDVRYVEEDIIQKLQSFAEDLRPLLQEVEYKATGTVKASDSTVIPQREKRLTSPAPFNLTRPKPRLIPEPEVISREVKALPLPPSHKSLAEVEEQKRKRLEEQKAKVASKYTADHEFKLETMNRREGGELDELAKKVEAERMVECTFKPKIVKYQPANEEAVVRQNAAGILREDALLKQKQEKEYQSLKRYEQELHDASGFYEWQEKKKKEDEQAEDNRIRDRMVEMQLSREGAKDARAHDERKKNIKATHAREETKHDLDKRELEAQIELEGKKVLVKDMQDDRELTRAAEERAKNDRCDNAEQVRRDKEAEAERKKREDEQEMERRKDLIRQIRSLEKVPVERFKQFDPAEAPCQGLLEEMSHAELYERLKIATDRRERELEEKRERQIEKKMEKQTELMNKAHKLAEIRERSKEEAVTRGTQIKQKQRDNEEAQQRYREQCTEEVAKRIQQKKQKKKEEELRLRKELKEISTKRQFLAANAEMVEAKAHGEQHAGLEREAKNRQRAMLLEQRRTNDIQTKESGIRRNMKVNREEEFKAVRAQAEERLQRAKSADAALKADITMANSSARQSSQKKLRDDYNSSPKYSLAPNSTRSG